MLHPLDHPTPHPPPRGSAAWYRLLLGMVVLVPVRLLVMMLIMLGWGIATELTALAYGTTPTDLPALPRRRLSRGTQVLTRFVLRVCGLWRLKISGAPDPRARLLVANHTSWIDTWLQSSLGHPQMAASDRLAWPVTSIVAISDGPIIDRTTDAGRKAAAAAIAARVADRTRPTLMIYPEGTVSNGRSLLKFKLGAFAPNAPVQPVVVRYRASDCDVSWTFGCQSYWIRVLAQPCFSAEVQYLPLHTPTEEDPARFAALVRADMAAALRCTLSHVGAQTAALMSEAERLGLPADVGKHCSNDPSISTKQHKGLLRAFAAVNTSKSGRITHAEFAAALPRSTALTPTDVLKVMGHASLFTVGDYMMGARRLLHRDAAHRDCGLVLLDPTGAVAAAYTGRPTTLC